MPYVQPRTAAADARDQARLARDDGLDVYVVTIADVVPRPIGDMVRGQPHATANLGASQILHAVCEAGWVVASTAVANNALVVTLRRLG